MQQENIIVVTIFPFQRSRMSWQSGKLIDCDMFWNHAPEDLVLIHADIEI